MVYFMSEEFKKHREKISNLLELIPTCEDIIFQPNFQHCLIEGHNENCLRIYRFFCIIMVFPIVEIILSLHRIVELSFGRCKRMYEK